MNWCLLKHKWCYKKEDIVYERITTRYSSIKVINIPIETKTRLCKRCHKKQRLGITGYWIDWDLTKDEWREIKLKELGL